MSRSGSLPAAASAKAGKSNRPSAASARLQSQCRCRAMPASPAAPASSASAASRHRRHRSRGRRAGAAPVAPGARRAPAVPTPSTAPAGRRKSRRTRLISDSSFSPLLGHGSWPAPTRNSGSVRKSGSAADSRSPASRSAAVRCRISEAMTRTRNSRSSAWMRDFRSARSPEVSSAEALAISSSTRSRSSRMSAIAVSPDCSADWRNRRLADTRSAARDCSPARSSG